MKRTILAFLVFSWINFGSACSAQQPTTEAAETNVEQTTSAEPEPAADSAVIWHPNLEVAINEARENGKPIFVIVGAPWCSYCGKLEEALEGKPETNFSRRWVLAKINADKEINDARELQATGLPSLRLLTSDGVIVDGRNGYASAGQVAQWLEDGYETTKARMPSLLAKDIEQLSEQEVETLLGLMAVRDVTARRVVLARLTEMPARAAEHAISRLAEGSLAEKLSALHLLSKWEAPLMDFDPWEATPPAAAMLDALREWASERGYE